ncbi:ABC transporter substrate-binding protein [Geomonas sp. RF6]|nr:ABC transporter substrate-binding protein [Geomonas sp. RF6]
MTVAFSSLPYAALAQVAQARGFFAQEGLEIVPLRFAYGKPALQAVIDSTADFATVAETPVMFAVMHGQKVSVIATIHSSGKSHAVVTRKGSGVRTPYGLRGKTIAVPLGTTAHFFLDVFLVSNGIPLEEVKIVDMKPDALVDALASGSADAVAAFDPYVVMARRRLGEGAVVFYDEDIYREMFTVVGRSAYVQKNPEVVRKVLRGLLRAQEYVRSEPAQAQESVAEQTGFAVDVIRSSWSGAFRVTLDQSLVLALEDESRWAAGRGVPGASLPNYLNNLYLGGLDAIQPQAVKILR